MGRLDLSRLVRTDWGLVRVRRVAGESSAKTAQGEPVFDLARAGCRSLVWVKISRLERVRADGALQSEVLDRAKNSSQFVAPPGYSFPPD